MKDYTIINNDQWKQTHIWKMGDWRIEWREGQEGYVVFPPQMSQYSFGTFPTLNAAKRAVSDFQTRTHERVK